MALQIAEYRSVFIRVSQHIFSEQTFVKSFIHVGNNVVLRLTGLFIELNARRHDNAVWFPDGRIRELETSKCCHGFQTMHIFSISVRRKKPANERSNIMIKSDSICNFHSRYRAQ